MCCVIVCICVYVVCGVHVCCACGMRVCACLYIYGCGMCMHEEWWCAHIGMQHLTQCLLC